VGQVTVPLSALVGVDDAPGELAGVGPIPASVARELIAQADIWRRLLTDPVDGHLVTQDVKTSRTASSPPANRHPSPADEATAPPDPLADTDRWPTIARVIARVSRNRFSTRWIRAHTDARAQAAERKLIHQMHAEAEASTDHQLIATINAEYLADDNAQDIPQYLAA
jgi:hypothetical protein